MAFLMNTELFTCDCGGLEFKVEKIKSFQIGQKTPDGTLLGENTSRKVLTCIKCGKEHNTDNLILKETEE